MYWLTRGTLGIWMAAVIVLAFVLSPPLEGLGESGRIVYFHVPCAWVGALAYLVAAVCGARYIQTRETDWDVRSASAAQIGLLFTVLATASGAIWAQASWGKWWNWDPRQVAIFVILLVYGAYFALRSSVEQPEQRAAISAVYSIIALVAAIFLIFVAPRLPGIESLHPSPLLPSPNEEDRGMDPLTRSIFIGSLAAFTGLFFWMWRLQVGVAKAFIRKEQIW